MATLAKNFTAVGSGTALSVMPEDSFTYSVAGTFAGTWVLERSMTGGATWERVTSGTSTATGTVYVSTPNGQAALYRFRCDLFTSGTIETSIVDAAAATGSFGGGVITTTEAGAAVSGTLSVSGTSSMAGVVTGTLTTAGAASFASTVALNGTVTAAGLVNLDGGLAMDTNKFTVANGTGDVVTAGNVTATGDGSFSGLALTKAGFAGSVALTIGADSTHGLQFKQIDEVVDLTALGAKSKALTTPIPAGAVIISAQANIDELVVAGGTTVKVALGLAAGDVDKYGKSADLVLNTKFNTIADWAVLAAQEDIAVCGVVTDGTTLGDTNISAGKVHVRIVYLQLASLANA